MEEPKNSDVKKEEAVQAGSDELIRVKAADYQKTVEELMSFKDKYVRLFAEFDNARKRHERERADLIKYAHEEVVVELLGVFDDLERSLEAAKNNKADATALLKGVEMIRGRLNELLKKYDVKPMESVGKMFDPHAHEVLMQIESEEHDDGVVIEEFQKGYTLGDRVVRTAKVKVAKNNKQ